MVGWRDGESLELEPGAKARRLGHEARDWGLELEPGGESLFYCANATFS